MTIFARYEHDMSEHNCILLLNQMVADNSPIPPATDDQKAAIIERVENILAAKANAKAGFDSAQPANRPLSGVEGDIPALDTLRS